MTIFLYALFHCFIFFPNKEEFHRHLAKYFIALLFSKKGGMAYTSGGYDSDVEGSGYGNDTGLGFTDKAVSF